MTSASTAIIVPSNSVRQEASAHLGIIRTAFEVIPEGVNPVFQPLDKDESRRMLAERIGAGELLTHEDFGIANAAKEALAFAILAHETLRGRPSNVPSATGARRCVVLGKIVPGG